MKNIAHTFIKPKPVLHNTCRYAAVLRTYRCSFIIKLLTKMQESGQAYRQLKNRQVATTWHMLVLQSTRLHLARRRPKKLHFVASGISTAIYAMAEVTGHGIPQHDDGCDHLLNFHALAQPRSEEGE